MNEQNLTDVRYGLRQLTPLRDGKCPPNLVADRVQRAIDALERIEERLQAGAERARIFFGPAQRCNLCGLVMKDESGDVHLACANEENARGDF